MRLEHLDARQHPKLCLRREQGSLYFAVHLLEVDFYLKGAKLYPFSNLCHLLRCSILANPAIAAGKQRI